MYFKILSETVKILIYYLLYIYNYIVFGRYGLLKQYWQFDLFFHPEISITCKRPMFASVCIFF